MTEEKRTVVGEIVDEVKQGEEADKKSKLYNFIRCTRSKVNQEKSYIKSLDEEVVRLNKAHKKQLQGIAMSQDEAERRARALNQKIDELEEMDNLDEAVKAVDKWQEEARKGSTVMDMKEFVPGVMCGKGTISIELPKGEEMSFTLDSIDKYN